MIKHYITALVLSCLLCACAEEPSGRSTASAPIAPESAPAPAETPKPKAYKGPFGLAAGLSLEKVKELLPAVRDDGDSYVTTSVPTGHDAFESYVLQFSAKSGLCAISAIGKDIQSGQTGAQLRGVFDALSEGLTEKYGNSRNYDFATGIMDDPQYFMMALSDKNRTLATFWNKEEGSTLPPDVSSIGLQAHASDMSTGYVNLRYEFVNIGDCSAEAKAEANKAL